MECLDIQMKAANHNNYKRDDEYLNRLFSYFRSQFSEDVIQMIPIRGSVFLLKTVTGQYIMKGYKKNHKLKLHEAFTETLKKEGFTKTYSFLPYSSDEQIFFDGIYYGCIEYLPPSKNVFSYQNQRNRQDGLDLLEKYHQTTALFAARYRTLLPKGNLIPKWQERYQLFIRNISFLKHFIHEPYLKEMVSWGAWALTGMNSHPIYFQHEPSVILHGDVAHHNFLRHENGELYLIDFDLISIGPPALDYLQYANRILPFMDWSFEKLNNYKQLRRFTNQEPFIYALAYPADIYREWNRLIREKTYADPVKCKQVMEISMGQFLLRKKFIANLKELLHG